MSLQKQQNLLAKLYTDAEFRRAFLSEPAKIGAENDLSESEIAEIADIMPEELNFFAESLFWKRLREVEKFLPFTKKALGEDFTNNFREFSRFFNPQTIKKHFEDALGFAEFLQKKPIEPVWAKDLAKFERLRLIFNSGAKKIVFARFNFDIRKIIENISRNDFDLQNDFPRKKTYALWIKSGIRSKLFIR